MLRKLVELLEIADIDWNNALDAEKKIYARLVSGDAKPAKKATAKKSTASEDTD